MCVLLKAALIFYYKYHLHRLAVQSFVCKVCITGSLKRCVVFCFGFGGFFGFFLNKSFNLTMKIVYIAILTVGGEYCTLASVGS